MDARKVLEMGGGTLLVSLPKSWARKNGIKKGSTMAVDELSGRKLIIRPIEDSEDKPREVSLEYEGEDLEAVMNDMTGAYLYGYDVIRVWGKKVFSRGDRSKLKATLARLVGLEIMDEDSKHITVHFLLEPSAISPERIVRRMSGIIDGMIKDAAEGVREDDGKLLSLVAERDDEIDRLYFLLVRTIRAATIHPEIAEAYGLLAVDVLDYRVLASFLESVGDTMAELSRKLTGAEFSRQVGAKYSECLSAIAEMNGLATMTFLSRRTGRSPESYAKIVQLGSEVSDLLVGVAELPETGPHTVETIGTLERASKLLVDIADLSVTARLIS